MQKAYTEVVYAGFWVRLAAFLIDSAIVGTGLLIVRLGMSGVMSLLSGTPLGGRLLFSYSLKDLVVYLCGALYWILCTSYTGTTPGKRLLNLRVIRADGRGTISFLCAVYRETVGRFLSGFLLGLGYLLVALDQEKRGLHDFLSDTRVIYAKRVRVIPKLPQKLPPPAPAVPQNGSQSAGMPQSPVPESQRSYGSYAPRGMAGAPRAAEPVSPDRKEEPGPEKLEPTDF